MFTFLERYLSRMSGKSMPVDLDHVDKTFHGFLYGPHMSNGLNLLHPRKDVAEMVIVFRVSLIVPKDLTFVTKSAKHVYQKSSFFVSPLSFLRVS